MKEIGLLEQNYVQKSEDFAEVDAESVAADLSADGDEHLSFSLLC